MSLTYRTRRNLKRWSITLLVILLVAAVVFALWVIWADRYIVYTRQGAVLDFNLSQEFPEATPAEPPRPGPQVEVIVHDPEAGQSGAAKMTSISGYYIDPEDLKEDITPIIEKVEKLPAGTAVMLDMKTTKGAFFYETQVGETVSGAVDQQQMNRLLEVMATRNLHSIARIPAFRDWEYGLNNVPQGLPRKGGGGALWMDDTNCYWLDPTNEEVISYLIRITMELKKLGFDEVVYTDFRFPETTKIKFEGDKDEAIGNALAQLVDACATDRFYISFYGSSHIYSLPSDNCRIYVEDVQAAQIHEALQNYPTSNPNLQLLFITDANDTRFDDYCVLRPLDNALQTLPTEEPTDPTENLE